MTTVQMIVIEAEFARSLGKKRSEQMWCIIVGQHYSHRTLHIRTTTIAQRPGSACGVRNIGVAEQHKCVDAFVGHGGTKSHTAFAPHARSVWLRWQTEACHRFGQFGPHQ